MGTINKVEKREIEMHISDDLKKEHQLILKYIGLMERYIEFSLENSNKPILLDKAEEFIGFIQKFADEFHHAKEENILFKHLAAPGVLTHCNPLPQMLAEHDLGRKYVQGMKDSLTNKDLDKLIESTRDYGRLLRNTYRRKIISFIQWRKMELLIREKIHCGMNTTTLKRKLAPRLYGMNMRKNMLSWRTI